MIKIVKDGTGKVIAYGPDDKNYDPKVPAGCTLEIVAEYAPPVKSNYQPLSAWQVRKVLNQFGLRDAVENAVKNSTDIVVKDAWNFANEFYRDNEVLVNMAYSLGITDAQLDQMYEIGINL